MPKADPYPPGTIVKRTAGGDRYRILEPPAWLAANARWAENLANGVTSSKHLTSLDRFYTIEGAQPQ